MIKFLLRLIKNVSILLAIILPLEILGWIILAPIVYINQRLLIQNQSVKLPKCFRWFDNADIYEEFGRNPITYYKDVVPKGWLYRYYWLAFRNPLNYFGYAVLGYKALTDIPSQPIGDSAGKTAGWFLTELETGQYEYYFIHKWNDTHCFRFRLGHKLQDTKKGEYCQWVMIFQPYRSYGGI